MLNLSASCTAKGAFCERSTDPCMQKQNQALGKLAVPMEHLRKRIEWT